MGRRAGFAAVGHSHWEPHLLSTSECSDADTKYPRSASTAVKVAPMTSPTTSCDSISIDNLKPPSLLLRPRHRRTPSSFRRSLSSSSSTSVISSTSSSSLPSRERASPSSSSVSLSSVLSTSSSSTGRRSSPSHSKCKCGPQSLTCRCCPVPPSSSPLSSPSPSLAPAPAPAPTPTPAPSPSPSPSSRQVRLRSRRKSYVEHLSPARALSGEEDSPGRLGRRHTDKRGVSLPEYAAMELPDLAFLLRTFLPLPLPRSPSAPPYIRTLPDKRRDQRSTSDSLLHPPATRPPVAPSPTPRRRPRTKSVAAAADATAASACHRRVPRDLPLVSTPTLPTTDLLRDDWEDECHNHSTNTRSRPRSHLRSHSRSHSVAHSRNLAEQEDQSPAQQSSPSLSINKSSAPHNDFAASRRADQLSLVTSSAPSQRVASLHAPHAKTRGRLAPTRSRSLLLTRLCALFSVVHRPRSSTH